jgi:MATE family multidrug resistance protein
MMVVNKAEAKILLLMATPLVIGQLAQTGMGVVDTMMAGGYGKFHLAAIALGAAVWLPVFLFMSGVLLALTPYIAQTQGAEDPQRARVGLMQGLWLAVGLAVLAGSILLSASHWLTFFSLEPAVADITSGYLSAMAYGLLPALLFQVVRFFHEGHGLTRVMMALSIMAFILNIPLNYIFVYGLGPIPEMGGVGCGVATSIAYLFMAVGAWWFYFHHQDYAGYRQAWRWLAPDWAVLWSLLRVGVPIAAAILFEVGLFTFIAFLVTPLGTDVLAAHQITISYTALIFMLPLSLAMALTVRVGYLHGAGDTDQLRETIKTAFALSIILGVAVAVITVLLAHYVVNLYTNDAQVAAIATGLFLLAALYQISDAVQVTSAGALRGIGDTTSVMGITFVAYWLIGLPAGYYLCYGDISTSGVWLGINGFWLSFVIGLSVAAIGLVWRIRYRFFNGKQLQA